MTVHNTYSTFRKKVLIKVWVPAKIENKKVEKLMLSLFVPLLNHPPHLFRSPESSLNLFYVGTLSPTTHSLPNCVPQGNDDGSAGNTWDPIILAAGNATQGR